MKPSEIIKQQVVWLKKRCKELKRELDNHTREFSGWYGDTYGEALRARLIECVLIKNSTEKFMKKLRHQEKENA